MPVALTTGTESNSGDRVAHQNRVSGKRGEHYIIDGGKLQVSLDGVAAPSSVYSASWFAVQPGKDAVKLCFGQMFDGELDSRVDVRIPRHHVEMMVRSSEEFLAALAKGEIADPDEWKVDGKAVAPNNKNVLEDAAIVAMAFSGDHAEMNFYQIPPNDVHLAINSHKDAKYRGPRPVVCVTMLTSQLRWLMEALFSEGQAFLAEAPQQQITTVG